MTTTTANLSTTELAVRCDSPTCGSTGQGKLLFRISPDHRYLYILCPRGHENRYEVDKLPTRPVD